MYTHKHNWTMLAQEIHNLNYNWRWTRVHPVQTQIHELRIWIWLKYAVRLD